MRSWKFSKSLSSVMFLRKGISVLIPGFDSSPLRDANSTVSRLKWGARTPLTHRPLCCLSHSRISVDPWVWFISLTRCELDRVTIEMRRQNAADPSAAVLSKPLKDFCCEAFIHTYIHTYIFINPRSHVTIQDAKTVSDGIEKGAKKN